MRLSIPSLVLMLFVDNSSRAADPAKDSLSFTGATIAGSTAITSTNGVYSLKFVGDETIEYRVDVNAGKPATHGIIEVFEAASGHFPIRNGGPTYLEGTNNWTVLSSFYTNKIALVNQAIAGNTLTLEYSLNFNGNFSGFLTEYTILGKTLRIRVRAKDQTKLQNNHNFNGLTFGESADLESPVIVNRHIQGTTATPIILFRNGLAHYYTANMLDLLKSHAKRYDYNILQSVPTTATTVQSYLQVPGNTGCYPVLSNGLLAHGLDETYIFAVSSKIKDVLVTSTAPRSPYLDMLRNRFVIIAPVTNWSYYKNAWPIYSDLGIYNLAVYFFHWSASLDDDNTDQNLGPDWDPPLDPPAPQTNFDSMVSLGKNYGNLLAAYTTFAFLPTSSPYYGSLAAGIAKDANGSPKLYTQNNTTALLGIDSTATFTQSEYLKLKGHQLNAVYWDIETYGSLGPGPFGSPLTEDALSPSAKFHHEGYATKKKSFKAARDLLAGPVFGEGSFGDPNANMEFLWHGYVDSIQRAINTGGLKVAIDVPAGDILAPTNFPIIPEYEWRVAARAQVNHGNGFYERFFGKSDGPTVVNMATGAVNIPLTQDARDLYNVFALGYAHAGHIASNGDQQPQVPGAEGGFVGYNTTAEAYFMTNALQEEFFKNQVSDIHYYYNGAFQTFDQIIFQTETTTTFQHIPIRVTLRNDLKAWFNFSGSPLAIVDGAVNYTLPAKTGWYAALPGTFQGGSFSTAATGGQRIDYAKADTRYEYFNGRGAASAFGGIDTGGVNLRKWTIVPANTTVAENPVGVLTVTSGPAPALAAIDVTPDGVPNGIIVKAGEQIGFLATAKFSNGGIRDITALVSWVSSKPGVAAINAAGVIQTKFMGTAAIIALTPGGLILDYVLVTVVP